ncbi:MAG TPA: thioesterase domain-containing protein [Gammaproteobacteria bacterium]|jgi:thioesterase domain-containing protein|nr:thioesterase domain-containing protein [Gammaproteobacteria bacterium]
MPFTLISLPASKGRNSAASPTDANPMVTPKMCLVSPNNVPIFLIPGIHGKSHELTPLAQALLTQSPHRPVYIYNYDPTQSSIKKEPTLVEQAKIIADQINDLMKMSTMPFALGGFSYGCMLAVEVAKLAPNKRIPVFLLDGVAKEATRKYYLSAEATHDMVAIVNSAAKMCGITPATITPESIRILSNSVDPVRRLENLHGCVVKSNTHPETNPTTADSFNSPLTPYLQILATVKHNFRCIRNSIDETLPETLPQLYLLLTNETKQKANLADGGWRKHAQQLYSLAGHPELNALSHLDLLKPENAATIARWMTNTIRQNLPIETLTEMQLEALKKMNEEAIEAAARSSESNSEENDESLSSSPIDAPAFPETLIKKFELPPTTTLDKVTAVPMAFFHQPVRQTTPRPQTPSPKKLDKSH